MAINERRARSEDDITVTLAANESKTITRGGRNYIVISTTEDAAVKIGLNQEPSRPLRQGVGDGVGQMEPDFTELNFLETTGAPQTVVLQTSYGTLIDNRLNLVSGVVPTSLNTATMDGLTTVQLSTLTTTQIGGLTTTLLANSAAVVAVGVAAVKIHTGTNLPGTVSIQNVGGSALTTIYIGWANTITTANYGQLLSAPATATLPGGATEWPAASDIWAIGSAANGAVAVMSTKGGLNVVH